MSIFTRKVQTQNKDLQNLSKAELLRRRKKDFRKRKMYFFSGLFSIFLTLCIGFFWISYFHVKKVVVTGTETLESQTVEQFVIKHITGNTLFVLPKKNVFLIDKKSLSDTLKKEFSRIDTLKIRKHFRSIDISIQERKPQALWCTDLHKEIPCYFVHSDGTIFEEAGRFSNPLFFVFYTKIADSTTPIGSKVLTRDKFMRVEQITTTMLEHGVRMYGYKKESDSEEIFYVSPLYYNKESAEVKTRVDQSDAVIVSNLLTALKSQVLAGEKDKHFSNTEYIDLRFDGKVFFKLKSNVRTVEDKKYEF